MTGVLDSVSSGEVRHGACGSGFGLHLCHMLARSIGTKLHLCSIENAWPVLSNDAKNAAGVRKTGTVLYFTLPVYSDGSAARERINAAKEAERTQSQHVDSSDRLDQFIFRPLPSPDSRDGSFRILIADDVLMLRKGLMNTLSTVFTDCPVSISTAATAEDMLRAAARNPYDLIICDNLFHHEPSNLRSLSVQEEEEHGRPRLHFDPRVTSRAELRALMTAFFQNERFTLNAGDGTLLGFNAITRLSQSENQSFATPLLMMLSGHALELPDGSGIIVAQKPLKQSDFCALIESAAPLLLKTNQCNQIIVADSDPGSDSGISQSSGGGGSGSVVKVYNRHGAQIFERVLKK